MWHHQQLYVDELHLSPFPFLTQKHMLKILLGVKPDIVWLTVGMPTGSGKSSVFKYLLKLINLVRQNLKISDGSPSWHLDVATFEKIGALMDDNDGRLLGIYDEMTTFLTQINVYKYRGHTDSRDVAVFLQLYNGHPWSRKTGMYVHK